MRILIDLQGAQNNSRDRGIGRYSLALAKAIAQNAGDHKVFILLNGLFTDTIAPVINAFADLLPANHFLVLNTAGLVSELECANDWRRLSSEALREYVIDLLAPDVLLISSLVEGGIDDTLSTVGRLYSTVPVAAILYDLIPLTNPEQYIGWEPARRWYMGKVDSLCRADLLLAISESAANEAIQLIGVEPARVKNILSAADPSFSSVHITTEQASVVAKKFGIKRKYLMHSSAFDARKNFQGLIRAFAALPPAVRSDFQLVLVCKLKDAGRKELSDLGKSVGLASDELVLTGFVSDEDLVALYSGCHLFVFPSFHEGFGLPVLEAMCCGVPAIGSNVTSIPEVIGRQDALFDPASTESMASLIQRALTDKRFYQSLKKHATIQSKKFSWDESAARAITAMEALVEQRASAVQEDISIKRQKFVEFIAELSRHLQVSDCELRELACHVAANERAVEVLRASAAFGGELTWRIEGPFDSTYSLALLNRETARALAALGHTVVLHSTEGPGDFPANPQFLADNSDLAEMHARVAASPHDSVDVASRNLYPPRVHDMSSRLNLLHHYAWEESGFPQPWVSDFNQHLSAMTCLSTHVEKVMIDNGVRVPMVTSGCGVDHWERVEANPAFRVEAKGFCFLHVSSCFPRKGADVLLEAYGKTFSSTDDVTLIIKTFPNPHNEIHSLLADCRSRKSDYPHVVVLEGDLSESDLKALYQQCNVLVAPSRAEGFGLPMAEAMLSGIPVVTTNWGGQLDFCNEETAWLVDYTFTRADTHFGLFASVWAEPDVDSLARTMLMLRKSPRILLRAKAQAGRRLLLDEYKWSDVAARLVNAARYWTSSNEPAPSPRIGWISTWNTKCGIAAFSAHLLEHFPHPVSILAPHQDGRIRPDDSDCVRSWRVSKDENRFDQLNEQIARLDLDTLVLQLNYGFYHFRDLCQFINYQIDVGRVVVFEMHSTTDPTGQMPEWNWKLSELLPALARCQRILVHTVHDLNRLKDLGLTANVVLFPLGIIEQTLTSAVSHTASVPLVATYGFCLPHKGLVELVQAADLLRKRGTPIRLRLVNAEFPAPESAKVVSDIRSLVENLSLGDLVETYFDYMEDRDSAQLLDQANLIVFPYQETNESASAAVRFGLATKRPVGVTPLRIFHDLGGAVFRFGGTTPQAIADGIAEALQQIGAKNEVSRAVAESAARWREAHGYKMLATRFYNILTALARTRRSRHYMFHGSSHQLKTQVGEIQGRSLVSNGNAGYLLFGPYLVLPAGHFRVKIIGQFNLPPGTEVIFDVVSNAGQNSLAHVILRDKGMDVIAETLIHLPDGCNDLEVRIAVESNANFRVDRVEIIPTTR